MTRPAGRWAHFGSMAAGALIAILAYEAGRARADGAPQADPLVYSGYLTDDQGTPVADGDRPMAVELFDTEAGGNSLCRTPQNEGATEPHPVKAGHFSIPLDADCAAAVHANSEVWVEVEISGAKMPRAKISAVPYALEADTASTARGARALLPEGVPEVQKGLRDLDCPAGFVRSPDDQDHVLCVRTAGVGVIDQMVLVGRGATSFWIDRYEASVWDSPDQAGKTYDGDYPVTFPHNGQIANQEGLLYARSVPGVAPSASLTWYQANLACRASGKRLPTGPEWQLAAAGTGDLTGAASPACNVGTGMKRATDGPAGCVSLWGAEDMIGNVGEMLADWQMNANNGALGANQKIAAYGAEYGNAATLGVSSYSLSESAVLKIGLPAVEVRGGTYGANGAGLFQLTLSYSVASFDPEIGFRCVIPR